MSGYIRNDNHTGLTNWQVVIDALPGKVGVSDIDGIIERKGHFLVMESKNELEKLPQGQAILLEQLSRIEKFTVLLVHMNTRDGHIFAYQKCVMGEWSQLYYVDNLTFSEKISQWFRVVDRC